MPVHPHSDLFKRKISKKDSTSNRVVIVGEHTHSPTSQRGLSTKNNVICISRLLDLFIASVLAFDPGEKREWMAMQEPHCQLF